MSIKPCTGCIAFTLLLGLVSSNTALGENSRRASKEQEARKACLTKHLEKGIELLADLYLETKDPTFLYNQGRCFEQNTRYEDAMGSFEEYLRKAASISESERAEVEKHIAECKSKIEPERDLSKAGSPEQASAPVRLEPVVPVPEQAASMPSIVANQASASSTSVPTLNVSETPAVNPSSASDGRGLRIAGLATGAVGVASIGTGVYFYTRAVSLSDKVTNSDSPSPSDHKAGKDAVTMQWVCYGVGAAALAAGGLLYFLGTRSANPQTTAVTPVVGPGLAGISAQGSF